MRLQRLEQQKSGRTPEDVFILGRAADKPPASASWAHGHIFRKNPQVWLLAAHNCSWTRGGRKAHATRPNMFSPLFRFTWIPLGTGDR